ncbi:hypothetical protein HMPREF1314_0757 [Bifidobacterium longum subsp. longum 35B]|nr:hypothetical protein HMPREF1314_0757 [Bifidobacterium longum subsp. longum 35B]EPE39502.1 hypothetical protein I118_0463 [Bifidobacterium longum D2957]CCK34418.1 hypothetical protein BN57_555 [Bifidobacterium longum subsp. longum CECT 7347]
MQAMAPMDSRMARKQIYRLKVMAVSVNYASDIELHTQL